MNYKNLLVETENGISVITINRPEVLNALSSEVFKEIYDLFSKIENDESIRVVILTGSGDKSFISGADINEIRECNSVNVEKIIPIARIASDKIYNLSKPVIAAINGFAIGGGCELAMCCDLRIASEKAKFGQPEINLAVVPGGGGMQRLVRLVGIAKAKELVYTGELIDANTALAIGLVNKVVPHDELMNEAKRLAQKLLAKSSVILSFAKKAINSGVNMSLSSGLDMDEFCFARCFATEDKKEGVEAFIEGRKPRFNNR